MNKEKVINILKSFEYFVDDDRGGYYTSIDCSLRATTPLGILKILDYIDDLNNENSNYKQTLHDIREYVNSDKLLGRLCEPKINNKGETHFDLIKEDILKIIDKYLGDSDEKTN